MLVKVSAWWLEVLIGVLKMSCLDNCLPSGNGKLLSLVVEV
jgi:hypothetical protein